MIVRQNKVLQMLGLAKRAGSVASGEFMTEKTIKEGRASLAIEATDASENTKKMFHNMCEFYHVKLCEYSTKEELGHAIGNEMRASLAVTNEGFANAILKHLEETNTEVNK